MHLKAFLAFAGKNFRPGKWTKIYSLHFEPSDFYNFWGPCRRTLREHAVPSKFSFPSKKVITARRQLNRVEASRGATSCEDNDLTVSDELSVNVDSSEVEDAQEIDTQLKEANDEITRLKQLLSDAKIEITELRKGVSRKRFGIEALQDSDENIRFYTGLPSLAVFYRLLEYFSPAGKRSNVVYNATAQNWKDQTQEMLNGGS